MSIMQKYFQRSELSFAAYANGLYQGMDDVDFREALEDGGDGMSQTQAADFASRWRVIDQYDGKVEDTYIDEFGQEHVFYRSTGLNVTLFEEVKTGKQVIAIRGTELDWHDWPTNIVDIAILGTPEHQAQYDALRNKINAWRGSNTLHDGFTVTGHSLGGFLATGLAIEFASRVDEAYIYNAPGLGGLTQSTSVAAQVWQALSPNNSLPNNTQVPIHNIVATWDGVSEVGLAVAPPTTIQIEVNANSIHNHSIVTLTDALAVYDLLAQLDPDIELETIEAILQSASATDNSSLEATVAAVGNLLGEQSQSTETIRDTLYQNIHKLTDENVLFNQAAGLVSIESLANINAANLASLAQRHIATPYALQQLNPFVITGDDSLYAQHNNTGFCYA